MGTHEGSGRALECGGAGAVVKTRGYFGTWPEEQQRKGKIQDRHHFVRRERRTEVLEGAGGGGWDPPPCYARPIGQVVRLREFRKPGHGRARSRRLQQRSRQMQTAA